MMYIAEGAIYEEATHDILVKVLHVPDTWDVSPAEAETHSIKLEKLEDETLFTVYRDLFESNYRRVADSEAEL